MSAEGPVVVEYRQELEKKKIEFNSTVQRALDTFGSQVESIPQAAIDNNFHSVELKRDAEKIKWLLKEIQSRLSELDELSFD